MVDLPAADQNATVPPAGTDRQSADDILKPGAEFRTGSGMRDLMTAAREKTVTFGGHEVVSFESRRATEMAAIIESYGGRPRVAPSMREVPLEQNAEAL